MPQRQATQPKDAPETSMADLAEQTGRHYRSPHLRRNRRVRGTGAWAVAAAAAVAVLLYFAWLWLR